MTTSRLADASRAALADGGALASALPGFRARPAQQDLSAAIADAFDTRGTLLAEAGTGTGKTFAYLVPALLSGRKTIVSTGTRALQDQLYHRDLPRVREALGVGLRTALLKGRANYLCHYRMRQAEGAPLGDASARGEHRFASREQAAQFQRIVAWSGRTRMGDLAELEDLAEDSPLHALVTSTAENCLGTECPFFSDCFVVAARQRAQSADVVVVNHHLLLADLALKQEGFGEILPGAEAFVIDEAHQLPELAAQFFGESLSARPLVELARDALIECRPVAAALATVQAPAQALEQGVRLLRNAMDDLPVRGTRRRAQESHVVEAAFDALDDALAALGDALRPLASTSPGFDSCLARAHEFRERLARWRNEADHDAVVEPDEDAVEVDTGIDDALVEGGSPANRVRRNAGSVLWYVLTARGFRLSRTPLDVAGPLAQHRARTQAAWVFTSATLAVGGRFEHFSIKLGLWQPRTMLAPSPFDWTTQALCYVPRQLPEPASRDYTSAVMEAVRPVLDASGGRAFLLFASHRALREAAELLRGGPWPLFVQGEAPRSVLLDRFRASGNGVLLGAASFREGVDVAGDALSVVVIDKLPFAAPDDPVFEARLDAIRRNGGNPFRDEQLPQAVIALKQGVGRLIRTETDRGVLVLCDPRLVTKQYGGVFFNSMPPFPRTRDVQDVRTFFGATTDAADAAPRLLGAV